MILFHSTSIAAVLPAMMLFVGLCSATPFWWGYHMYDEITVSHTTTATSSVAEATTTFTATPTFYTSAGPSASTPGSSSQSLVATPAPSTATSGAPHALNGAHTVLFFGPVMAVALMLA